MKKQYEIKSKSSNGGWAHREYKVFEEDKQAHKYADLLTKRTNFEHKAVYVTTLEEPDSLEVRDEINEGVEDLQSNEGNVDQDGNDTLEDEDVVIVNDEHKEEATEPQLQNENDLQTVASLLEGSEFSPEDLDLDSDELLPEPLPSEWEESHDTKEFPTGWWLQKKFVAKDGTVYNKKKEVPELYRKLYPSDY